MKFLNSGNVIRLALDQIEVGDRLRKVSQAGVENLRLMAEDTGITTPIHVRKVGGKHILVDGAHRMALALELELPDIACLVVECRADEARGMEASNNLGAVRMTPLQTAVFVASWKRDYYALHPDRATGVFKGNRHTGKLVDDFKSLTTIIADTFSITERQAHRMLAAGEALSPAEIALLDGPKRVTLADLQALAKADPDTRAVAVACFAVEPKIKLAQALKPPASAPVKDPIEDQLKALRCAWNRAGTPARRRFLSVEGKVIFDLLRENRGDQS